jgi:hypothetical protein
MPEQHSNTTEIIIPSTEIFTNTIYPIMTHTDNPKLYIDNYCAKNIEGPGSLQDGSPKMLPESN